MSVVNLYVYVSKDGKLELQAAAFSMDDMVEMIMHSFKPLSESKSVALVSQLDPSLPPLLYGDRHRISQIIGEWFLIFFCMHT